jgi:hypothetical protein
MLPKLTRSRFVSILMGRTSGLPPDVQLLDDTRLNMEFTKRKTTSPTTTEVYT